MSLIRKYNEYKRFNSPVVQPQSGQRFLHETRKLVSITTGSKHKYRHAKEMKVGHGGLNGEISLPPDYITSDYRLILSVVPGINSTQLIHPCMLHVTVMESGAKQKRARYRTELKSPEDWRVILDVVNGEVFYVPNYGAKESLKVDCLREGQIRLGQNNLQLTIISPLQGKRDGEGIKLSDVIRERIKAEDWKTNQTGEQLALTYMLTKEDKINLHVCRLRAQLYKVEFVQGPKMSIVPYWKIIDEDISQEILDGRDQNVGSFDLESMSEPNQCCTEGKWKITLVSKYKTATVGKHWPLGSTGKDENFSPPVFPVFIFVDETDGSITRPEHCWPKFNQIGTDACNLTVHGGAFVFSIPPQNYEIIKEMTNCKKELKLSLYRSLDGVYAEKTFSFKYHPHYDGCAFCIIRLGTFNEPVEREMPSLIPIEYFEPEFYVRGLEENMNTETEWNKEFSSSMEENDSGTLSPQGPNQEITFCKLNTMNVVYNDVPVLELKKEDVEYEMRSFENEAVNTDDICLAVRTLQRNNNERLGHGVDKFSQSDCGNLWNKIETACENALEHKLYLENIRVNNTLM